MKTTLGFRLSFRLERSTPRFSENSYDDRLVPTKGTPSIIKLVLVYDENPRDQICCFETTKDKVATVMYTKHGYPRKPFNKAEYWRVPSHII
jgi:hypothetical protein